MGIEDERDGAAALRAAYADAEFLSINLREACQLPE
jgi:hypothetical protein